MEITKQTIIEQIESYNNAYDVENNFYDYLTNKLRNIPNSKRIEFLTNLKNEILNFEDYVLILESIIDSKIEEIN